MSGKKQQPKKPAKKSRGRPAFEPTDDQRRQVKAMTGYGIPQDQICVLIVNPHTEKAIDGKTLRKHFAEEIASGAATANTKVAETLFQQAMGKATVIVDGEVTQEAVKPNIAALIFWCKTRMCWQEVSTHKHTGPDGGAILHKAEASVDLSRLTDKQLALLESILADAEPDGG